MSHMQVGYVRDYDATKQRGRIMSGSGRVISFLYVDGQNMAIESDGLEGPRFTGHHQQNTPNVLKTPAVGDAVLFVQRGSRAATWAYARHYLDLLERRFGTQFAGIDEEQLAG